MTTWIINFLLLSLPQGAQLRVQSGLCRMFSRCISGLLGNPPPAKPSTSQSLLAMVALVLDQTAGCFTAELNGDEATVDLNRRSLQHALKGAIRDMPPDPFASSTTSTFDPDEYLNGYDHQETAHRALNNGDDLP